MSYHKFQFNCYYTLAIPIFLTAIASFFAFFDSLRFTALLCVISIGIILLASLHIITRPSQASETDSFYQLFLSVLVNGVIILLFFVAFMAGFFLCQKSKSIDLLLLYSSCANALKSCPRIDFISIVQ